MDRLSVRSRLSPSRLSPISPGNLFPTVLEEPATPTDEYVPPSDYGQYSRRHLPRRRLPLLSSNAIANSSRSFDSGISGLLSETMSSPSPPRLASTDMTSDLPSSPFSSLSVTDNQTSNNSTYSSYLTSTSSSPKRSPPRRPYFQRSSTICNSPSSLQTSSAVPSSPTFKQRPSLFSSTGLTRRFSDNSDNGSSHLRTLSPSSNHNSAKSSPSPILRTSLSLQSNDSDTSPPPTYPSSPPTSPGSPIFRASRRMLPEPPSHLSLGYPRDLRINNASTSSSSSTSSTVPPKPYSHLQKEHAWPTLTSHDSLDSGVYSRSTTSDSNGHARNLSSPVSSGGRIGLRGESPPVWRRSCVASSRLYEKGETKSDHRRRVDELYNNYSDIGSYNYGFTSGHVAGPRVHFETINNSFDEDATALSSNSYSNSRTFAKYDDNLEGSDTHDRVLAYSNPHTLDTPPNESVRLAQEPAPVSLDVPKLRDLKSHSFPPPWARDDEDKNDHRDSKNILLLQQTSNSSDSSTDASSDEFARSSLHHHPYLQHLEQSSADERRKRWLFYTHTVSGSGYVS